MLLAGSVDTGTWLEEESCTALFCANGERDKVVSSRKGTSASDTCMVDQVGPSRRLGLSSDITRGSYLTTV